MRINYESVRYGVDMVYIYESAYICPFNIPNPSLIYLPILLYYMLYSIRPNLFMQYLFSSLPFSSLPSLSKPPTNCLLHRFDMLLFVGTPNKVARQERLRQKLLPLVVTGSGTGTGVSGDRPDDTLVEVDVMVQNQAQSLRGGFITAVAASRAQKVLSEIWDEYWSTLRFATYAENEALMGEVKELVLRGDLTKEKVLQRLEIIQRTATVQGAVRDDYIESEGLSRL